MIYYEFLTGIDLIFVKINKTNSMEIPLISEPHKIQRVSVVIANSIWNCIWMKSSLEIN